MLVEVAEALANTALLAVFAVPLAFSIGYAMGALAGSFPGRWIDRVVTGGAVVGVSLPNYWLGIVLVIVFAVELHAAAGDRHGAAAARPSSTCCDWSNARFLILPVDHPGDGPDRHPVAHHARRGRRSAQSGFRPDIARQGPVGMGGHPACR